MQRSTVSAFLSSAPAAAVLAAVLALGTGRLCAQEPAPQPGAYYRLRQGVTFYVPNPDGVAFEIALELKDINTCCQGAQTALFKVYDPDGEVLHREDLPDDGVTNGGYQQAWAGWDHELWARGALRELGAEPLFRADASSDPAKLDRIKGLTRTVSVKGGRKGLYQIQLAGCDDHFVSLRLSPSLSFGVLGHPDFFAGHGDQFRTAYLYVPPAPWYVQDRKQIEVWIIEHGWPRTRRVSLYEGARALPMKRAPQGDTVTALTPGHALGRASIDASALKPGTVLKLVNEGAGDYLLRIHGIPAILCPDEKTARLIEGAVQPLRNGPVVAFPFQAELWKAVSGLKKEDFVTGVTTGAWFKTTPQELQKIAVHAWAGEQSPRAVDAALARVDALLASMGGFDLNAFFERLPLSSGDVRDLTLFYLYPFEGNGLCHNPALRNLITLALVREWSKFRHGEVIFEWGELNVAYAEGFHWDFWEPVWNMKESFDPAVLAAFQKGARQIADRLAFANALELVITNGRTTVPLNLYHAFLITDDPSLEARSKDYLARMVAQRDGPHAGRSPTGYFREHFGPDGGYCTYPLYQLGRLYQLSRDPAVLRVMDELCRWICYVSMPGKDRWTGPTSWNARIAAAASEHIWGNGFKFAAADSDWAARMYRQFAPDPSFYDLPDPVWQAGQTPPDKRTLLLTHLTRGVRPGAPVPATASAPAFTDVGGGHEFFTVRRGRYYAIVYAGRRIPFWLDTTLDGASNFGGGGIAGLSVADGASPLILGRLNKEYGWPPEKWEELSVPVAAGETSDGRIFNTGVCRSTVEASASDWTVRTTGEAVSAPVDFTRAYRFLDGEIAASIEIANADLNADVFQYRGHFRPSHRAVRFAWEIIPCATAGLKVTCLDAAGNPAGELTETPRTGVAALEVRSGQGAARLILDKPREVKLGTSPAEQSAARPLHIRLSDELAPGASAKLDYRIVPLP